MRYLEFNLQPRFDVFKKQARRAHEEYFTMDTGPGDVTKLLEVVRNGYTQASNELWAHVLPELRNQAAALLRHERSSADLQATIIVNEVYLKMNPAGGDHAANFEDRGHFFGCRRRRLWARAPIR